MPAPLPIRHTSSSSRSGSMPAAQPARSIKSEARRGGGGPPHNPLYSTDPMALVNGIKLEARLQLGKARLMAQGGQLADAMQTFQTAAELWPGNPDLNTSS